MSQIKGRYEKELRGAKRPAIRKILNKDVSAGTPMILCVSQILRFKSKAPKKDGNFTGQQCVEEIRLELSDGWYAVSCILDSVLTNLVEKGKLTVGSKLMICNAELVGSDDGVDPLDDGFCSDRRNCPIHLRISAKNSRRARWDAKLGFVHPKYTGQHGGILVKSLGDILPDGGAIPAIELIMCKRYPQMFLEQIKDAGNKVISSSHLTEAENAASQSEYDRHHQSASEKFADTARKECSEVRSIL